MSIHINCRQKQWIPGSAWPNRQYKEQDTTSLPKKSTRQDRNLSRWWS